MVAMKKFLVIGNFNAISYKEIFPMIKDNKVWLGTQYVKEFVSDSGEIKKFGNILWYTNLDHNKRHKEIILYKKYNEADYPKYDNYKAIEVSKVCDIPMDYEGVMGVPVSFMDKYCPDQFEIVGWSRHNDLNMDGGYWLGGKADATINGVEVYRRILIRIKKKIEIVGIACGNSWANYPDTLRELGFNPDMKYGGGLGSVILNGKALYTRLFVKLK